MPIPEKASIEYIATRRKKEKQSYSERYGKKSVYGGPPLSSAKPKTPEEEEWDRLREHLGVAVSENVQEGGKTVRKYTDNPRSTNWFKYQDFMRVWKKQDRRNAIQQSVMLKKHEPSKTNCLKHWFGILDKNIDARSRISDRSDRYNK